MGEDVTLWKSKKVTEREDHGTKCAFVTGQLLLTVERVLLVEQYRQKDQHLPRKTWEVRKSMQEV